MRKAARVLLFALVFGLVGALPGYLVYCATPGGRFFFGGWGHPLDMLRWYSLSALPVIGTYCFAAGIPLAFWACRKRRAGASVAAGAALLWVPVGLLATGWLALLSAAFWAVLLAALREPLFGA